MIKIALALYTTIRWKMTATASLQSVKEVSTLHNTHRHGCTVNYTWGRMLRCKSSAPLCSAHSASVSLAPNSSYEHLLLPHASLNRTIIGQISISFGNVIIGIYCMFPSYLYLLNSFLPFTSLDTKVPCWEGYRISTHTPETELRPARNSCFHHPRDEAH